MGSGNSNIGLLDLLLTGGDYWHGRALADERRIEDIFNVQNQTIDGLHDRIAAQTIELDRLPAFVGRACRPVARKGSVG
jgi:hypothetical protein